MKTPAYLIIVTLLASLLWAGNVSSSDYRKRLHTAQTDITTEDDVRTEIRFGRDIAARILGKYPLLDDPKLQRYVNLVGRALALHSSRPELKFYFAVLNTDHINAYSTPGGYIFITRGALSNMRDESELAAVLGHEIAHITQKHIVNALNIRGTDTSALSGISRMIGGSQDTARVAFSQAVDRAVKILFETGYQQADELTSDNEAVMLLAATEYDPVALSRYLKRISRLTETDHGQTGTSTPMTHPPTSERMAAIKKQLRKEGLTKVEFERARKRFRQHVKEIL